MNLKESLDSYVVFYGPPFVGKSGYYTSELSETFKRISPSELFQMNSALSLRQLINNYIVKPLLEGEKVAVDDDMQTMSVRRSYADTVLSKIPKIQCSCLAFRPEFGKMQLLWKREILLAEAVLNEDWHSLEKILATDIDVWYGKCDPILDTEQLRKFEVTLPLQIYSRHPFQIPCLMIECKGSSTDVAEIVRLLENWCRQNKHGRVIAIYEADRSNRDEVEKSLSEFLKSIQLMSERVVFAYLVDVGSSGDLTQLTTSVLAFLMRLHCLDLFSSNSVYLYESMKHRKMVESVGMRHIKLARALTNPDLLRHGTTQFLVPKMLQSMRVLPPTGKEGKEKKKTTDVLCVPLLQKALESDNCIAKVSIGNHRTLYIAARNVETLNRYQQQLLEDPDPPAAVVDPSSSGPKSALVIGQKRRLPSSSFKMLPSWMMSKRRKTLDLPLRSKIGQRPSDVQPSTIYIMSEQELLKTAEMVLKEGTSQDSDASARRPPLQDRKKLVKEEKSDPEEGSSKALERKANHNYESDNAGQRLAKVRSCEQVSHTRTSKNSPKSPQFKSPTCRSPNRLSELPCGNSVRKIPVDATDDAAASDVCEAFVEGMSASKSRSSSKSCKTVCTREPKTITLKGNGSPEVIGNLSSQVDSSSMHRENLTGVDKMNFLNEVLTGRVSEVRPLSKNDEVSAANTRSPAEKKLPKRTDSDISHFIDSLIS